MIRKKINHKEALDLLKPLLRKQYNLTPTASILFYTEIINRPQSSILVDMDNSLSTSELHALDSFFEKAYRRIPLAYILGNIDFYNENYRVNSSVLIPRADSELIVDLVLRNIEEKNVADLDILEIGTGSGCLSISILNNSKKKPFVTALDISKQALNLARTNAANILDNTLHPRIQFKKIDLFQFDSTSLYDIIISNPPYIPDSEYSHLDKSVYFEPTNALKGGRDGLKYYRKLAELVNLNLKEGGKAFFEIHSPKSYLTSRLFENSCSGTKMKIYTDLNGLDRVLEVSKLPK